MMKRVVFLLLTIVGLWSCGSGSTPGSSNGNSGASISGTIEGAEGQTLVLQRFDKNQAIGMDSVVVGPNGQFELNAGFSMPLDYYSLVLRDQNSFMILLTDSTETVQIEGRADQFQNGMTVKGSPNTTKLQQFYKAMDNYNKQMDEIQKSVMDAKTAGNTAEVQKMTSDYRKLTRDKRTYAVNFVRDESPSPAILAGLTELNINVDLPIFEKAYSELRKNFGHSYYHEMVGNRIADVKSRQQQQDKIKKTDVQKNPSKNNKYMEGSVPPNIVMNDPKGNTRELYDLRGKYVLIDFWASWCGPCRRENPNVVALYNKYKNKGFEIFSVSLDKQSDRWIKAIEQDNLIWPNHVSDLKGWQSEASQLYGVSSIPHTILLDPEGKVIGAGLRGQLLENKLQSIFN